MNFLNKLRGTRHSATVLFNSALLGVIYYVGDIVEVIHDSLPTIAQWLPANTLQTLAIIILVGNIVLRFKTRLPLEDK